MGSSALNNFQSMVSTLFKKPSRVVGGHASHAQHG